MFKFLIGQLSLGQKKSRHATSCTFFGTFSNRGKFLKPTLVVNQMKGYENCARWKERKHFVTTIKKERGNQITTKKEEVKKVQFDHISGNDYGCNIYQRDNSSESNIFSKMMFTHNYEKNLLPKLLYFRSCIIQPIGTSQKKPAK